MATTLTEEELYFYLAPAGICFFICALAGLFGNMIMLICFFREKKFHTPCHCMIALNCFADMIHLNGQYVFVYHLFFKSSSTQEQCFWMLFPTQIGIYMSGPLIISLGVDRLIACSMPLKYRMITNHSLIYLLFQLVIPLLHTFWLCYSAFIRKDPTTRVKCAVPYAMGRDAVEKFTLSGIIINSTIIIIYFVTFLQIRKYSGNHVKAVFKSIGCTVIFVLTGWSTVTVVNIFGYSLITNPTWIPVASTFAGIGVNVAGACNVFVFYSINAEYREAIRKTLGMKKRYGTRVSPPSHAASESRQTKSIGPTTSTMRN